MKKKRKSIPQKLRAILQKEIASSCPFCNDSEVAYFEVHHIDENPSNNSEENLIMLCRICHSKITKGDILHEEVLAKKRTLPKSVERVELVTVVPNKSCSWRITSLKNDRAFHDQNLSGQHKNPYLILSWTFINHTSNTIVLNKLSYLAKSLPSGLSGLPKASVIETVARYDIEIRKEDEAIIVGLEPQIQVPGEQAFTIETLLHWTGIDGEKYALSGRGYIDIVFFFSRGIKSEEIRIYYNCESEDEKMMIYYLS